MAFGKFLSKIYAIKAGSAYRNGNVQETLDWLEKAYKTGCAQTNVVTTYGYVLLKYGKLEEAINVIQKQLSSKKLSNSDCYNIKSNYALALWKKGQLDDAISLYEEIIANFKTTNNYGSLGYLYNIKGNLEKALSFNLEAYDYNNSNGVIMDNLGQTYYLLGELEKANEIFKKLMDLNPKFPEAFYDYALVYEKMGNKEKCIEKLRNALLYKPNFLSAITIEDIEKRLEEMEKE